MNTTQVNASAKVDGRVTGRKPPVAWLVGIIALQASLLTVVGVSKAYTLQTGQVVVLKARPVDPRDMFRGEYLRLQFDISEVPCKRQLNSGDRVFVVLKEGQPYWTAIAPLNKRPQDLKSGEIALAGTVGYCGRGKAYVNYGLGQYFMPEGRSAEIERRRLPLDVEVAIDDQGNSAIKRVLYNGKPID